jgi:hypothetical protein
MPAPVKLRTDYSVDELRRREVAKASLRAVHLLRRIQAKSPFRKRVADFFQESLRAAGRGCGRVALLSKHVANFF